MGKRARERRERRAKMDANKAFAGCRNAGQADSISDVDNELNKRPGDAAFQASSDYPAEMRESDLEDIRQFESVGSGISLFEGLQQRGMVLPHPEGLDEAQSKRKVLEVLGALADLRIFLIGFEKMSAQQLYATLWNQTLWEACYVRKRNPWAITMIDLSRRKPRSGMLGFLEKLKKPISVH